MRATSIAYYFRALSALCILLSGIMAEPRIFNFRDAASDDSTSARDFKRDNKDRLQSTTSREERDIQSLTTVVRRYSSENGVDYFRLLAWDAEHIVIGGADALYNISIATFRNASTYHWPPASSAYEDCRMKNVEQHACHNYIRIAERNLRGEHVVCGTNAYKPRCRVLSAASWTRAAVVSEFTGNGLLPLDPRHNTTVHMDGEFLYAATVADFSGTDALIFRRNATAGGQDRGLRTQRNNDMLLNRPQFVGELHSKEYVYFFFREEANEADTTATFSRVARVCKNDRGGPRNYYEAEWTSFVKARLNCSISEKNRPFYFDEIIAISNLLREADGREIFYATFVSEFNFLRHSVICAFDLAAIDRLFVQSDVLVFDAERPGAAKWTRKSRGDRAIKMVGHCPLDSRKLTEEDAIQLRKYALVADAAPNVFARGAVGIHRGSDHYSQIAVLPRVEFHEGIADVLYVATDHGNIIKMVNLARFIASSTSSAVMPTTGANGRSYSLSDAEDPLVPVAVFKVSSSPIRSLLISDSKYLIVVTDTAAHRLPLHTCGAHSSCRECIASRDPHCVWHNFECAHLKAVQKRYAYQDVLAHRGNVCAEVAARDGKESRAELSTTLDEGSAEHSSSLLHIDLATKARHNANYTSYYHNRAEKNCNCALDELDCKCDENFSVKALSDGTTLASNNSTLLGLIQSYFPTMKDVRTDALPWWVFVICGFAATQTVVFLYLCCRLHAARRRRRKSSATSSASIVVASSSPFPSLGGTKNCGAKSATVVKAAKCSLTQQLSQPLTYAAPSEFISAYSCGGAVNGSTVNVLTKSQIYGSNHHSYSAQNLSYSMNPNQNYYHPSILEQNYDIYRRPLTLTKPPNYADLHGMSQSCATTTATTTLVNKQQHQPYFGVNSNASLMYSMADERATALATATLSRPSMVGRMCSFSSGNAAPPYRNANTLDCRASGRRQFATLKRPIVAESAVSSLQQQHKHKLVEKPCKDGAELLRRGAGPFQSSTFSATPSENSSTMSSGSTNVTQLSSCCSDVEVTLTDSLALHRPPNVQNSLETTTHRIVPTHQNVVCDADDEEITIQLEGSALTASILPLNAPPPHQSANAENFTRNEMPPGSKTHTAYANQQQLEQHKQQLPQQQFQQQQQNYQKSMALLQQTPSGVIIRA